MIKYTIYNDLHIGSKYQDNPNAQKEIEAYLFTELDHTNVILNGDILDFTCAPRKNLHWMYDLRDALRAKFGAYYRMGNHEACGIDDYDLVIPSSNNRFYLVEHGDLLSDYVKWSKYRQKSHGSSKLGQIKTALFDKMDWLKGNRKLPTEFVKNAIAKCKRLGLNGIIVGHFHPLKRIDIHEQGIHIIVLPAHYKNEVSL